MELSEDQTTVEYAEAPTRREGWEIVERDGFPVLDQISWCLRKASEHDARIDEYVDLAARERKRVMEPVQELLDDINNWEADALSGEESERDWFITRLEQWAIADRLTHIDKAAQTKVPAGRVSTTVRQAQIRVVDAEEFYNWWVSVVGEDQTGESADGIVSWVPKISVRALRASNDFVIDGDRVVHKPTGEIPAGLAVAELTVNPKVAWS